jgi:peptide/nickel transport system permease protein
VRTRGKYRSGTRWTFAAGCLMMAVLVLLAVFAPLICSADPMQQDLSKYLLPPGSGHPLGTDQLGRDMLSRVLYAGRTDLSLMVLAEIIPFCTGTILGMMAGYYGGAVNGVISLITDTLIAFPYYLLVILIAFFHGAGISGIFLTFIIVGWIVYARVAKGVTGSLAGREWVQAAKLTGYSDFRILFREILPNVFPQVLVVLMTDMAGLLVMIVTLGYLGIGITAPTPDWGSMIAEGQSVITTAWWLSVIPGLFVVYTGIALSLIGDGLADRLRGETR